MTEHVIHATHPAIVKRLKRANGHQLSVIKMIADAQPCNDIAQQLTVSTVKRRTLRAKRE
jgi:DNA-binding FrmR family transcriptional regulator